jgi:hypothetical protein
MGYGGRGKQQFTISWGFVKAAEVEFRKSVGNDLAKEVRKLRTLDKITNNVVNRLNERYPFAVHVPTGRIREVIKSISKGTKRRDALKGNQTSLVLGVGHIKTLDRDTQISKLDRSHPMRHMSLKRGNPKKSSAPSASRYHLWRLLEKKRKTSYTIKPSKHPTLNFTLAYRTSQQDDGKKGGFSGEDYEWQSKISVRWRSAYLANAEKFNYFITLQKTVHDEDKRIMKRSVESALHKLIKESKFRR